MQIKIKLPVNTDIKIKPGTQVDFNDSIYQQDSADLATINYTDILKINAEDIFRYTDKFVGQSISSGEIIAHKKTLFKTNKVISQHQGIIERIDHLEGLIFIRPATAKTNEIKSFFQGKIISYDKKDLILTLEINSSITGIELLAPTDNGGGEFNIILDENRFFTLREDVINNKIVITDNITVNLATKLSALGASGIIYTEGSVPKNISSWQLINKDDIEKISRSKVKYVIISAFEKKLFLYN